MAKTIKFNLILDKESIRNITDLQENFCIEDIVKYYRNGLLEKWLLVRNFQSEYKSVSSIDKKGTDLDIAKALIKIFSIETDEAKIDTALQIYDYLQEEQMLNAEYVKNKTANQQIIDDYHAGYTSLYEHMLDNFDDFKILKADAFELENKYMGLFMLDYIALYERLIDGAPKAVYAIMTRPALSNIWLNCEAINKRIMRDIVPKEKILLHMEKEVTIVKRDTQGMWDPIESEDVKLIILYISSYAFAKNFVAPLEEKLGQAEINGKFKIFNGLHYQCNSDTYEMIYLEV